MKRLHCLDGLRGLLAVYVLLGQMAPFAVLPAALGAALSHGGAAVDVFFILSGLVIQRSLETYNFQWGPFLRARVARIFPVYLVMFALAIPVQAVPTPASRSFCSKAWRSSCCIAISERARLTLPTIRPTCPRGRAWVSMMSRI